MSSASFLLSRKVKARENAACAGVADKIKFVAGTAAALPFPDKCFDLVISYASLHHWFEPEAVFKEIGRVTKASGRAIIRHNKRVYRHPVWKIVIWLISRFMNRRHRQNWPKVIIDSYTIPEARKLLARSGLASYFSGERFCLYRPLY